MKNLLLLLFGFSAFAWAQAPVNLALVNPSELFAAHPSGQEAAQLVKERNEELGPLSEELQTLQRKAESTEGLSPEERARASLLVRTLQESQERYAEDIRATSEPARASINSAVSQVAQANGYALVLDAELASTAGLGLIVYVDPNLIPDITEAVIEQMNAQ